MEEVEKKKVSSRHSLVASLCDEDFLGLSVMDYNHRVHSPAKETDS